MKFLVLPFALVSLISIAHADQQASQAPLPQTVETVGYATSFGSQVVDLSEMEREDLIIRAEAEALTQAESQCQSVSQRATVFEVNVREVKSCGSFIQVTAKATFNCLR